VRFGQGVLGFGVFRAQELPDALDSDIATIELVRRRRPSLWDCQNSVDWTDDSVTWQDGVDNMIVESY